MRNNIAFLKKSVSSKVTIYKKINVEFIFALNFAQISTQLLLDFSKKKSILFLIYLPADKGNVFVKCYMYLLIQIVHESSLYRNKKFVLAEET